MKQTVLLWLLRKAYPISRSKSKTLLILIGSFRLLLVVGLVGIFVENCVAQQITGGPATVNNTGPDAGARSINIYTFSSGGGVMGNVHPTTTVPTNFGSVGQPISITFNPVASAPPTYNSAGVSSGADFMFTSATTVVTPPLTQPTNLTFTSPTQTSYTVSFTPITPTPAGYLVLRKAGSATSSNPSIQSYNLNDAVGDATVVSVGSSTTFNQTGLTPGTIYYYRIFSYNGSGFTTGYKIDNPLEGNSLKDLLTTPQPTVLTFSNATATSLTASFNAAAGADGYVALRKSGSLPTAVPLDATVYTASGTLGDATVVYSGSTATFNDASLTPGTEYFYAIYSYKGSGIQTNYLTTSPLTSSSLAAVPTAQPTALAFSNVTATSLTASFSAAAGASGYIALRKSGSLPTSVPIAATAYSAGNFGGEVVYVGSATTFNDTGLTPGAEYFYAIISFNGSGITLNYLTASPLTSSTLSAAPTAQPTSLVFSSVTSSTLTGSYTAAAGSDGYIVLRKSGSAPTAVPLNATVYAAGATLGDATVAYSGSAVTFNDASLAAGTDYFYKVFSYKGSGISTNYLTTSPLSGDQFMESVAPTALIFSGFTSTSLNASFTAAANATGYLAIRKEASSPTGVPVDGTSYTVGATLGDGQVAFFGAGTSFSDTGLTGGTVYFYDIYSYTGAAAFNYVTSVSPLEGSATTLSAIPTAQPTALVFTNPQPTQLTLTWTASSPAVTGYIVLRKIDADPTGVPIGGTAYTAGATLGDATVVYSGTNTTFVDLSLTGETFYYYQVMAFNGSGAIINYLTTSPLSGNRSTLATQPSAQPYALQFTNIGTNTIRVSFTNSPTTPFPNGYLAIRKLGSAPTGVPVDGTTYTVGGTLGDATVISIANTNQIDDTGLSSGTTYFYTIYAYNGGAGAYNYLVTGPLQGSAQTIGADSSPPSVTSATPTSIAPSTNLVVKATATESNPGSVTSVSLEYRSIAATTNFTTAAMSLTSGTSLDGTWQFTIPAAQIGELGIEYKITATNSTALTSTTTGVTIVSFDTQQSLPFSSFGSEESNYRIISVPLVLKNKTVSDVFVDDLGPVDNTKWRVYRYEGGSTNELNASSTIDIGKGYWLIAKTQTSLDFGEGTTASVTNDQPFKIDLVSGWNQIGNPYLFNVLWSDVVTATGGAALTLRTYNGNFANGTKLNKYEGGFVQVGAATSLLFPVTKNPAAGRSEEIVETRKTNALDNEDWEVRFNLVNGSHQNSFGGVGMNPQAKDGYDSYDDFTLPRFLSYVELNHHKTVYGMKYTKDILPTTENSEWEFTVESNLEGVTNITWDNSYFGKNDRQLVLWDVEEKRAVDMRDVNHYLIKGREGKTFNVFFGSKEYVKEKTALKSLLIHSISPNPTDGETKIAFSTSGTEETLVNVQIVDLMGKSVSTVFNGNLTGGFHEVTWSGKDGQGNTPAQGVYIVEVTQGKERGSKRLIVK